MELPKMLTPKQVAEILNVDADTVRRLADSKQMEHTRIGRQYRFTPEALQAYIKSRTIKATNNKFLNDK